MADWSVERIVHFDFNSDFVKDGLAHFGFHDKTGSFYAISHPRHFMGLVGKGGLLLWTVAKNPVFSGIPNIHAPLYFPIFVDRFADDSLVVSNFGDNRLYRVFPDRMKAELLVDGNALGIMHAGNCVVDDEDCIWLNEVEGCRVRKFDQTGRLVLTLGKGIPGFQSLPAKFDEAMFNWIYDVRKGPDGNIYVLDSKNFAVRVIDVSAGRVFTIAGTGMPGYSGDGGDPMQATFGGDKSAWFDGPISLSLDEAGNIYVGDRFNRVVRMIDKESNTIVTIAGDTRFQGEEGNGQGERDPLRLRLPKIASMDYWNGRLFVPTDLTEGSGDLVVLLKAR
jgi:sugar lactone lactonase YvrE